MLVQTSSFQSDWAGPPGGSGVSADPGAAATAGVPGVPRIPGPVYGADGPYPATLAQLRAPHLLRAPPGACARVAPCAAGLL